MLLGLKEINKKKRDGKKERIPSHNFKLNLNSGTGTSDHDFMIDCLKKKKPEKIDPALNWYREFKSSEESGRGE